MHTALTICGGTVNHHDVSEARPAGNVSLTYKGGQRASTSPFATQTAIAARIAAIVAPTS